MFDHIFGHVRGELLVLIDTSVGTCQGYLPYKTANRRAVGALRGLAKPLGSNPSGRATANVNTRCTPSRQTRQKCGQTNGVGPHNRIGKHKNASRRAVLPHQQDLLSPWDARRACGALPKTTPADAWKEALAKLRSGCGVHSMQIQSHAHGPM